MESLSVQCKLRILEQNTVTRTTTNMWTPLALLALVAPALAVPCGKNFTITSANKGDACLGATYDSGFATVTKCNGSPGQTWITGQVGLQGCTDPTAGKRNQWMVNSQQQLVLDTKVEGESELWRAI